jgi:hypothetical protein
MSAETEEKQLSYSGWVRQQMLLTPNLTLEQLQEAHDKSDWDKASRPTEKQLLYLQKGVLCKRWGIKSLDELPRNSSGVLNLSGMVRLFLKKYPNKSGADCVKFFALDGLDLSDALFFNARTAFRKKQSPDDNQHAGPRAGKPEVKEKKEKKSKPVLADNVYIQMLLDAKKLVQRIGGIGPTRKLLDILETIQS